VCGVTSPCCVVQCCVGHVLVYSTLPSVEARVFLLLPVRANGFYALSMYKLMLATTIISR
jgi:hypothetical protein